MSRNSGSDQRKSGRRISGDGKSRYHHGDLRRALIEAVMQMTRDRGDTNFSLADVCRELGVSTAAPYRHFENLDQLCSAAVVQGFAELDALLESTEWQGTWKARLAHICSGYLEFMRAHPGRAVLMFEHKPQTVTEPQWDPTRPLAYSATSPTEAAVTDACHAGMRSFERYAQHLATILEDSPLAPAFSTPLAAIETALALWSILQGVASQWLRGLLPEVWLDNHAAKIFEILVLPWALGMAAVLADTSER